MRRWNDEQEIGGSLLHGAGYRYSGNGRCGHDLPHVGVIIDGGTLKFNAPDGKVETLDLARGAVGYRDANVTHEPINPGKTPIRVIEVEIK